jgi:hypothetical protein
VVGRWPILSFAQQAPSVGIIVEHAFFRQGVLV